MSSQPTCIHADNKKPLSSKEEGVFYGDGKSEAGENRNVYPRALRISLAMISR